MKCPVCGAVTSPEGIQLGGYPIFRCTECGLRFAPNAFDAQVDYDEVYESDDYVQTQVKAIGTDSNPRAYTSIGTYRPFFKNVVPRSGRKLLDIGCGVGRFLQGAHSDGWQVEGIDSSSRAIETGKRYAAFPMSTSTMEELASAGRRYDVVTVFEVLEHLADPLAFLAQAKNLLEPDGSVFCTVPNWDCSPVQHTTNPAWLPPVHLLFFTESSLAGLLTRAGFTVVHTGTIVADQFPVPIDMLWPLRAMKWVGKRLLRQPRHRLGVWVHARIPKGD